MFRQVTGLQLNGGSGAAHDARGPNGRDDLLGIGAEQQLEPGWNT